jgi:hypothetical protein
VWDVGDVDGGIGHTYLLSRLVPLIQIRDLSLD